MKEQIRQFAYRFTHIQLLSHKQKERHIAETLILVLWTCRVVFPAKPTKNKTTYLHINVDNQCKLQFADETHVCTYICILVSCIHVQKVKRLALQHSATRWIAVDGSRFKSCLSQKKWSSLVGWDERSMNSNAIGKSLHAFFDLYCSTLSVHTYSIVYVMTGCDKLSPRLRVAYLLLLPLYFKPIQ